MASMNEPRGPRPSYARGPISERSLEMVLVYYDLGERRPAAAE